MVCFGTRPEAVKMAPVLAAAHRDAEVEMVTLVTAQHRELLDQVLRIFDIAPDYDLQLERTEPGLNLLASQILARIDTPLLEVRPQIVLVQGDTTSALMCSLAAFHRGIAVAHLEAGLRTHDLSSPYPEEGNRRAISQIANLHLAPTPFAKSQLLNEGVKDERVVVTGNTVVDALHMTLQSIASKDPLLTPRASRPVVLVTMHRRESWGEPMRGLALAVSRLAELYPHLRFVLPMHRNQGVRRVLYEVLDNKPSIQLVEPLDYEEFTRALSMCALVMTDSGGVQEEAPSLNKPVLLLRRETERPEGVTAGCVEVVGTNPDDIVAAASRLLESPARYHRMAAAPNPFGDGKAAARTLAALKNFLGMGARMPDFDPDPQQHMGTVPVGE